MLEDFRLKVFITVAQEGSFTKAAKVLGITQPAVSQNVAELEKGLGVKLFERLPGEIVLTQEGQVFDTHARSLLMAAHNVVTLFEPLPDTRVSLSVSEDMYTCYIGQALDAFTSIHPNITFERTIFDAPDLRIAVRPSAGTPYDIDPEVIAKARISLWSPSKNIGGNSAAHENTMYFDIVYQPSQAFALTKTCRLLKDYLASLL